MSSIEQFKTAVIAAGAEAKCIERGPGRAERLVINTPGGLITKEIPLKGELDKDIEMSRPRRGRSSPEPKALRPSRLQN